MYFRVKRAEIEEKNKENCVCPQFYFTVRKNMKEDKRIAKTKRGLKCTFIELLKEKPYEQIFVKEICERSSTTRITFYTHYKDKADLLNDIFRDFTDQVQNACIGIDCGNDAKGLMLLLKEMIRAIVKCIYESDFLLSVVHGDKNSYLLFAFKCYLTAAINQVLAMLKNKFHCKYTTEEASAFIRGGFVAMFSVAVREGYTPEALEKKIVKLVKDIVESDILFVHK